MASITRETGRAGPRNRGDVACGIYLPDSVVEQIRNEDVPGEIDGQSGGLLRAAEVAAAPSPLKPAAPVPAKVVTFPPASILRTRWLL